ncbi:MAG: hypothetical protein Q4B06_01615 [Candidatus Saccharibacteria bacterium]|nr:hypothetical protein [Candidatus Saccharibacteria bacterium]
MNEEEYGSTFADDVLAGHVSTALRQVSGKAVVIGNRSIDGIDRISEVLGASDRKIVYVDAPTDLLHERYQKREQHIVSKTEFKEMLDRDRCMGLTTLIGAANAVIDNCSHFETAVQQFQSSVAN